VTRLAYWTIYGSWLIVASSFRYSRTVPVRRVVPPVVLAACLLVPALLGGVRASAVCGTNPDDPPLTIKQMIRRGTTGERRFDVLLLGRVRRVVDIAGGPGGKAIARMSVRVHPVGFAPHRSRIRTRTGGTPDDLLLGPRQRYALVAHRIDDGSFRYQISCGQSKEVSRHQMRRLLRLVHRY
jgi:hypothetical protein